MGTASRRNVPLGSSSSVADDLRLIRSRGGFNFASPSDLLGTANLEPFRGLGPEQNDIVRAALRQHTQDELADLLGQSSVDDGDKITIGARSLNTILFSAPNRRPNFLAIRDKVGLPHFRSADFVRKAEDVVLDQIGLEFVAAIQQQALRTSTKLEGDASISEHRLIKSLVEIRTTLFDIGFVLGGEGATLHHDRFRSDTLSSLFAELLLYLHQFPQRWSEFARHLQPTWRKLLDDRVAYLVLPEIADLSREDLPEEPPAFIARALDDESRLGMARIAVEARIGSSAGWHVAGIRSKRGLVSLYQSCDHIILLVEWMGAGGQPGEIPALTNDSNGEIIYAISRRTKYWQAARGFRAQRIVQI